MIGDDRSCKDSDEEEEEERKGEFVVCCEKTKYLNHIEWLKCLN